MSITADILLFFSFSPIVYLSYSLYQKRKIFRETRAFLNELLKKESQKRFLHHYGGEEGLFLDTLNDFAKKYFEKFHEAEEQRVRLKTTLRSLPNGILLLDELGYIRFVNPAFEELFSQERLQLLHKRLIECLDLPELSKKVNECIDTKEKQKLTVFSNHIKRFLEINLAPIEYKSNQYIGIIAIFRDITEEKQVYETRKDFVANVSHELKTPLTVIRGAVETLLDGAIERKNDAKKFVQKIQTHTGRMENLINDLITLSRIELGALPLEWDYISPVEVIDEVFEDFEKEAERKNLYLQRETESEFLHIEADRNRLLQILTNLVSNSLKYTNEGGVTVKVESEKEGGGMIEVVDTGIGVPKESIARLGERFYLVDPSRSREFGGTGLGLAIVKHLVKSHGWEMSIESNEGKGTSVKIFFSG